MDMRKKFTKEEILAIREIYYKYGYIKYINDYDIEHEYFTLTGNYRSSGTIYMAHWRDRKGIYNHLF